MQNSKTGNAPLSVAAQILQHTQTAHTQPPPHKVHAYLFSYSHPKLGTHANPIASELAHQLAHSHST